MKKCNSCGIEKDECEFPKDKTHKDGLSSLCKECRNKRSDNWRKANQEKFLSYQKDRLKNGQAYVNELKSNCVKCNESRPYVIQFHHINPSEKEFELGSSGVFKSKFKIDSEVKKCICLCANCHMEYHWLYGKTPEHPVETLTEYLGVNPYEI